MPDEYPEKIFAHSASTAFNLLVLSPDDLKKTRGQKGYKVYTEPTNRCNLEYRTCVRWTWDEPLGKMSKATFARSGGRLKDFCLSCLRRLSLDARGDSMLVKEGGALGQEQGQWREREGHEIKNRHIVHHAGGDAVGAHRLR